MFRKLLRIQPSSQIQKNYRSDDCGAGGKKGLILGVFDGCNPGEFKFTSSSEKFNDELGGKLKELIFGAKLNKGQAQVFMNLHSEYDAIGVAGLGSQTAGYDEFEFLDECKENIRIAAGAATKMLQDKGVGQLWVEGFTNPEAAAEGSTLAAYMFQEYRSTGQATIPKLDLYESMDRESWQRGIIKGQAQNIARNLEETPANLMTPTHFAQKAIDILCPCGVQVEVRDKDWIEMKKMSPLLTISKGSCEPPLFLEIGYCAGKGEEQPVILIGKGVTFDSGGINLRKCHGMDRLRGDMAGAAVVVGVMRCIAQMNLPINVRALIPLCENMTGGMSVKPGDVVVGINGKTIRIDHTAYEARVILADTLTYSGLLKPCLVLDIATLTEAAKGATGSGTTPFFTTSPIAWKEMRHAGGETGDRVWRFPLWKFYTENITNYIEVDVNNVGKGVGGHLCKAASLLWEFAPTGADFCHLDITGTGMISNGIGFPYLRKGYFTGRPVRTIAQFLYQLACPHEKGDDC